MSSKEFRKPEEPERFDFKQHVASVWDVVAQDSYKRFLKQGRGVNFVTRDKHLRTGIEITYIPENNQTILSEGWPSKKLSRLVQEYDPATEALFLCFKLTGGLEIFRLRQDKGEYPCLVV